MPYPNEEPEISGCAVALYLLIAAGALVASAISWIMCVFGAY